MAAAALETQDSDRLYACAMLETIVHGQALLGGVDRVLAHLLTKPESNLSTGLVAQLTALAEEAVATERSKAAAHVDMVSASVSAGALGIQQLREALSATGTTTAVHDI